MKRIFAVLVAVCVGGSFFVVNVRGGVWAMPTPWELELEEYGRIFIMTPTRGQPIFSGHPASYYAGWDRMFGWVEYRQLMPMDPITGEPDWDAMRGRRFIEERVEIPGMDWGYDEERMQIRSGLYYNTYPLVNIYYVYEYFYPGLFFAGGGSYFAQVNGVAGGSFEYLDGEAVRFFANGRLIASYQVGDLVSVRCQEGGGASLTSAGISWIESGTLKHDQQAGTLSLVARDGNAFTFDITTGAIISQANRHTTEIAVGTMAIALAAAVVIFIRYRRRILSDRK